MGMTLKKIVELLQATSSRTEKEDIIRQFKDQSGVKELFIAALNPYIHFYAHSLPQPTASINLDDPAIVKSLVNPWEMRDDIKSVLQVIANSCDDESDRDFWESVISKDLGCGVGASTVNKVWPKLIPKFSPMKGEEASHLDNMVLPLITQPNLDGGRVVISQKSGVVSIFTSSGRPFPNFDHIKKAVKNVESVHDFILDAELVFTGDDGQLMSREVSNGLATKASNGNLTVDEEKKAKFFIFDKASGDALDVGDNTPYSHRWHNLKVFIDNAKAIDSFSFELVVGKICHTRDEIRGEFNDAVARGEEGIMVKTPGHPYEPKRSKHWCKLKKSYQLDLIITDVKLHKKKKEKVGAIYVESSDGVIKSWVGTKLSEAQRDGLYIRHYIDGNLLGTIWTIEIHDLTIKKGEISLSLPRVIEERDKTEADDSEKIFGMVNWDRS